MLLFRIAVVAAVAACSRERGRKAGPEAGAVTTVPLFGQDADAGADARRREGPPPQITAAMVLEAGAGAFVDKQQGFLLDVPPHGARLVCDVELEHALQQLERVREHARGLLTCEPRGSYTDCAFDDVSVDVHTTPESAARFVFAGDDPKQPVLVAALLGTATNWVQLMDEKLAEGLSCKTREVSP